MAREFTVPVGAAFDKRLAELAWESCSQLAKETVSGKLAMTVDFNSDDIIHLILQSLNSAVVEKLKPKVLDRLNDEFSAESLTRKLAEDGRVSNALLDIASHLHSRVQGILESLVAARVQKQVELIIDHDLGSDFTSMVMELARKSVESHVERRLGHGKEGVALNRAEERIRQEGQ